MNHDLPDFHAAVDAPILRPVLVHVVRDPEISGSQRVALDILCDSKLAKFRRIIVCGNEVGASAQFRDEIYRLGIEPVYLEWLKRDVGPSDVRAFIELFRLFKVLKPVLVHTHSAKPFLLAGLAAFVLRVPRRVHTLHGISFHRFTRTPLRALYYLVEQLGSVLYHRVVSVNAYYPKFFPLARLRDSVVIIPNGIALPSRLLETPPNLRNEFSILFAGRLNEQKDPLFLLDVAESIEDCWTSDLAPRFYLAGDGPLFDRIAGEIATRGLAKKVKLLGWVTDLAEHYAMANVLFLPSRWEACGLVLIEAAAYGCPAVASNVEGIPEVIQHGWNGLLFEQGNVLAACQSLARIASDPNFRRELAERARADAKLRDVATMRSLYLDVYRRLGLNA